MYIARLLYPVKVLGPGNRVGIWFAGCRHGCDGCSNPELWSMDEKYKTNIEFVKQLIEKINIKSKIDGFTVTGGDPFFQPNALSELFPCIRNFSDDILVYTGYKYSYIKNIYPHLLKFITVLIDGKYIKSRNNNVFLRGSDNQKIYILDESKKEFYNKYIAQSENQVQNFRSKTGFISVGIHKTDYKNDLELSLNSKGIIK